MSTKLIKVDDVIAERALIDSFIEQVRAEGPWDVAQASDGHSRAWHGVCILVNAKRYLDSVPANPKVHWMYTPIFTR